MGFDTSLTRKEFLGSMAAGLVFPILGEAPAVSAPILGQNPSTADLEAVSKLFGLKFEQSELAAAIPSVRGFSANYESMRKMKIDYSVPPATWFVPIGKQPKESKKISIKASRKGVLPKSDDELPGLTVLELADLIKSKKLTSERLTRASLDRLKKYGPKLFNVITLMESESIAAAKAADAEIKAGKYRGPLHGIPYGIKDLFAAKGHPTTWGAEPFKNQVLPYDSAVVERLREAGAVLCAKMAVGALAMDDKWFGGQSRNSWKPTEGSSGSSAGSASAVSAALLPFAIGTETLGSIVSPSHRCRVTGLRPTYGRVSRYGAMALSWTMDKAGPIGRTAEDTLVILAAMCGADSRDPATVDRPISYTQNADLKKLKIAYLEGETPLDEEDGNTTNWKQILKEIGVEAVGIKITPPDDSVTLGLSVEGAAAFDEITRSSEINTIKNSLWPGIFRANRFVSAVEYVQSLRARTNLMTQFEKELGDFDVILSSDRGSHLLITTNCTGHPQLYIPLGVDTKGRARGLSLIGRLYGESALVSVAQAIQEKSGFYRQKPDLATLLG